LNARHGPFRLGLLANPFYVLPRLASIRSWDDLLWRAGDLVLYLRARWRMAVRPRPDPARAAGLLAASARQEALRRWAVGRGLDIGSGGGSLLPGRAQTLDYDPRWRFQVDFFAPCDRIPAADGCYDFAVASHVLEHLRDPAAALLEWGRVVRPGGSILLFLPDCRFYVPDRLRLDAGSGPVELGDLLEARRRGEPNSPPLAQHADGAGRLWTRHYCRHHYLWRAAALRGFAERLGFAVLSCAESSDGFARAFSAELLPAYSRRRFIPQSDAEPLSFDLLDLQRRLGEPRLDYSFIVVLRNPGPRAKDV
jgi:SAM-dependent methyltransferase